MKNLLEGIRILGLLAAVIGVAGLSVILIIGAGLLMIGLYSAIVFCVLSLLSYFIPVLVFPVTVCGVMLAKWQLSLIVGCVIWLLRILTGGSK